MASAWGVSFGVAWGSAWGTGDTPVVTPAKRRKGGFLPAPRKKKYRDEQDQRELADKLSLRGLLESHFKPPIPEPAPIAPIPLAPPKPEPKQIDLMPLVGLVGDLQTASELLRQLPTITDIEAADEDEDEFFILNY